MLFPSGSLTGENTLLGTPAFPEVVVDALRTADRAGVPVIVLLPAFAPV